MTQYTITANPQFNSLEISFDGKPSEDVRAALKALKFRWHGLKKIWYGFATEEEIRKAVEGRTESTAKTTRKAAKADEKINKFGVKVGDIFRASWGYEQTNNDFFQVIALVGESSIRVREVNLPMIDRKAVSGMAENRTFSVSKELLPAAHSSVFIKDQEKGDLKRLKSYSKDGKHPQFNLSSFCDAHLVESDKITVYESWYY